MLEKTDKFQKKVNTIEGNVTLLLHQQPRPQFGSNVNKQHTSTAMMILKELNPYEVLRLVFLQCQ